MKLKDSEAWLGTGAALLLLVSSMWEGFASLIIAIMMILAFSFYKNAHSQQKWQLKTIVYVLLTAMMGLLDWVAIRSIAWSKTPVYWAYLILVVTLTLVYLTVVWEQNDQNQNRKQ